MIHTLLYRRKRRDRWWRYKRFRAAFIAAQCSKGSELGAVARVFSQLGHGQVPKAIAEYWLLLVSTGAQRSANLNASKTQELTFKAETLDSGSIPALAWLDLSRLCIGIGLFHPARVLRDKAMDGLILEASQRQSDVKRLTLACYAFIERGDYSNAHRLIQGLEEAGFDKLKLAQVAWLTEALTNDDTLSPALWEGTVDERMFSNLIGGESVALVGPVASKMEQGGEIDSFALVVKFGYRGGEMGRDLKTQGGRIDISYYNNAQAQLLSREGYSSVFSDLRWAVCNNPKGRSFFPKQCPGLRSLRSLHWLMPDSHLNAGPNALLDLLRFGPVRIKVFNTDLMLSAGRFTGYQPRGAKPIDYTRSFIKTHDPILQYRIMHRLWSLGRIEGDDRFDEVMQMGLEGYLSNLQQAYGAVDRALF